MTDAETVIARVLGEHDTWDHNCVCGEQASDPSGHVAAEVARALRDAALLPEATTRVEWGVSDCWGDWDFPSEQEAREWFARYPEKRPYVMRRTRTEYADHVTEWEPAE